MKKLYALLFESAMLLRSRLHIPSINTHFFHHNNQQNYTQVKWLEKLFYDQVFMKELCHGDHPWICFNTTQSYYLLSYCTQFIKFPNTIHTSGKHVRAMNTPYTPLLRPKKKNVSGNPTDPVKNSLTLIFFSCFPKIKTRKSKKRLCFSSTRPAKEYRRISQLAYRRLYDQYMRMCSNDKMAASSGSGNKFLKICSLHIQQGLFTGMSNLKMIAKDK